MNRTTLRIIFILFAIILYYCCPMKGQPIETDTVFTNNKFNHKFSEQINEITKKYIIYFDTHRNTKDEGLVANGKWHGEWLRYEGDTLKSRYNFDSGVLQGPYITYYSNGRPENISYYNNNILQSSVVFHENGQLGHYLFFNTKADFPEHFSATFHTNGYSQYISESKFYNKNGKFLFKYLFPTLDSLRFTSAACGDEFQTLTLMLNDTTAFHGISNLKTKVYRKKLGDTVFFEQIIGIDSIIVQGQLVYECNQGDFFCCWKRVGKWIYYKNEEIINIKEDW